MAKLTLSDVNLNNFTETANTINENMALIETAMENTLSRNGTTPNQMGAALDMNSNRILNLPAPLTANEPLRLADVDSASIASQVAAAESAALAAQAAQTIVEAAVTDVTKLVGSSTSSVTIGTGTKTFTTQANKFFSPGTWLVISSDAAPTTNQMTGIVSSYTGTSLSVLVSAGGTRGSGTYADWTIRVSGTPGATGAAGTNGSDGADGVDGVDGADGATGPAGADAFTGLDYLFQSGVQSSAALGSISFNVSPVAVGVATMYIHETGNNSADYTSTIDAFDISTSSGSKGILYIYVPGDPNKNIVASITGTVVDNGSFWAVPLSILTASGTIVNGERLSVVFSPAGNTGSGAGDVLGPPSSTNNGYAKFDGTTGKVLKNSAATIPLVDLNINGGTAESGLVDADRMIFYDTSAAANRNILFSQVKDLINFRLIRSPQIFTSGSSTWTKPAGCKLARFILVGGGGAGGGPAATDGVSATGSVGGGGGAGRVVETWRDVSTDHSSASVSVGTGGTGTAGATGGNGNTTSVVFTTPAFTISASGGTGATALVQGTSQTTVSGGSGTNAISGETFALFNTGGGSGIRLANNTGQAGDGGSTAFGTGGLGARLNGNSSLDGSDGAGFGAGGGGGINGGGSTSVKAASAGGDGTGGLVIIFEYA